MKKAITRVWNCIPRILQKSYRRLVITSASLALAACSSGPMTVQETYFLRASNGLDTAYLRVKVTAKTRLGDAEFRQGWFPDYAVDELFGDLSEESQGEALLTRNKLRKRINDKIVKAYDNYLKEAIDPNADEERLQRLMNARKRILLAPVPGPAGLEQVETIEYNTAADIVLRRSGHKLVFVLSNNPDAIIMQMAAFAESAKTEAAVLKMRDLVAGAVTQWAAKLRAQADGQRSMDEVLIKQLAAAKLNVGDNSTKESVLLQIYLLLSTLELANSGGAQ